MQATFDTGDRFALHTELAGKPHLGPAQCPTPRSQQSAQPVVDVVAGIPTKIIKFLNRWCGIS